MSFVKFPVVYNSKKITSTLNWGEIPYFGLLAMLMAYDQGNCPQNI